MIRIATNMRDLPQRSVLTWIEWLPSTSWLLFMVVPLVMQGAPLDLWSTKVQLLIVSACAIAFLIADATAYRSAFVASRSKTTDVAAVRWIAIVCTAIAFATTCLHLLMMPKIPILLALGQSNAIDAAQAIAQARADATKLLSNGPWIDYLSTWSLVVFAPMAVALWFTLGYRWFAVITFAWICSYAISTTAKFPLVICTASILFALSALSPFMRRQLGRLILAGIVMAVGTVAILAYQSSPSFSSKKVQFSASTKILESDPRRHQTLADNHRIWSASPIDHRQEVSPFVAKADALIYRSILGPSDVSIRWYQYFTTVKSPIGFASALIRPPTEERPSRLIAQWAYAERFPTLYRSFANANASFDADAYSREGGWGAALAICLLVGLRLCILPLRGLGSLGTPVYCIAIALLSLLTFHSSLQAIIFVHGFWIVLAFMAFSRLFLEDATGASTA